MRDIEQYRTTSNRHTWNILFKAARRNHSCGWSGGGKTRKHGRRPRYDKWKNYRREGAYQTKWHCARCKEQGAAISNWCQGYIGWEVPYEYSNIAAYYFLYDTPLYISRSGKTASTKPL